MNESEIKHIMIITNYDENKKELSYDIYLRSLMYIKILSKMGYHFTIVSPILYEGENITSIKIQYPEEIIKCIMEIKNDYNIYDLIIFNGDIGYLYNIYNIIKSKIKKSLSILDSILDLTNFSNVQVLKSDAIIFSNEQMMIDSNYNLRFIDNQLINIEYINNNDEEKYTTLFNGLLG